jgi:probable addiction module antidote protein
MIAPVDNSYQMAISEKFCKTVIYELRLCMDPMDEKITDFDPAGMLKTDEAVEGFLTDAFETGDAHHIASALGVVARAKGMTKVARETGLAREQLYKSLSMTGNPTLETTLAVMKAVGFVFAGKRKAA